MYFLAGLALLIVTSGQCQENEIFQRYLRNDIVSNDECETQKQALLDGLQNKDTWTSKSKC